jgi:hypothetical protein
MNIEEVRCWRCGEDGSEAEIDQYAGCNSCGETKTLMTFDEACDLLNESYITGINIYDIIKERRKGVFYD